MDETELRALLQADDCTEPRAVTVADVDRRVRAIRRRRIQTAGSLLMVGVALVAAIVLPGRTAAPADDIWSGVMSRPSPGAFRYEFSPGPVLYLAEHDRGGRRTGFRFDATGKRVGIAVECAEAVGYAFVWVNGELADQGPCGLYQQGMRHMIQWWDPAGRRRTGPDAAELLVVPIAAVESFGHGRRAVSAADAARIAADARSFPIRVVVTVHENDYVYCPYPQQIVITDRPSGRRVLSSTCPPTD
jgi:hypothetical protein